MEALLQAMLPWLSRFQCSLAGMTGVRNIIMWGGRNNGACEE